MGGIEHNKMNNKEIKLLNEGIKEVIKFSSEHPDILITRADKGNSTVIMDLVDYKNKMQDILTDDNTYSIVNKDSTNKMTTELRTMLIRWKNKKFIDQSDYNRLYVSAEDLPRSFWLSKINKDGYLLRMIVISL